MRIDDMGDDEQQDEIREYERYIEDPPADRTIREDDDDGRLGVEKEVRQEWTPGDRDDDDDRPAEVAAMEIERE